jgi:hypothetical protein
MIVLHKLLIMDIEKDANSCWMHATEAINLVNFVIKFRKQTFHIVSLHFMERRLAVAIHL